MVCGSKYTPMVRLDCKTAIITGCNTGIGKETVKEFYRRGARIVMACRNMDKAKKAAVDIKNQCSEMDNLGEIAVTELDLMSFKSIRNCAERILEKEERIDLLINNAGVMMCPQGKTEDGFETQFATNHLGHFLFTMLLLPKILKSSPARIVNVSSMGHKYATLDFDDLNWETRTYSPLGAYAQTKLANILFTQELAKRLREANINNVTVYSLHPGVIATDLARHMNDTVFPGTHWIWEHFVNLFIKTPEEGAQTTIYCAIDEKCADESGLYYSDCKIEKPNKNARDKPEDCRKLWEESWKMVGLDENYNPFV